MPCLAATNAQLCQQLIERNKALEEKDQKYIALLEKFYLQREKWQTQLQEKNSEIDRLRERVMELEKIPLVEVDGNDLIQFNEDEDRNELIDIFP